MIFRINISSHLKLHTHSIKLRNELHINKQFTSTWYRNQSSKERNLKLHLQKKIEIKISQNPNKLIYKIHYLSGFFHVDIGWKRYQWLEWLLLEQRMVKKCFLPIYVEFIRKERYGHSGMLHRKKGWKFWDFFGWESLALERR